MGASEDAGHYWRGGDEFAVVHAKATPKAFAQFDAIALPGDTLGGIMVGMRGGRVRSFADGSPFFVYETGRYRLILCVKHGYDGPEEGQFRVVGAQPRHRR